MNLCKTALLMWFLISSAACVTTGSAGSLTRTNEPVCYTRAEHTRLVAFQVRCRGKVRELRQRLAHETQKQRLQCENKNKQLTIRLHTCLKQTRVKHTCSGCLRPALVGGLLGAAAVAVAWVVVELGQGIQGAKQ
jgi:hypothetical protein